MADEARIEETTDADRLALARAAAGRLDAGNAARFVVLMERNARSNEEREFVHRLQEATVGDIAARLTEKSPTGKSLREIAPFDVFFNAQELTDVITESRAAKLANPNEIDELLVDLAPKYLWWKSVSDPSLTERRLVAQIMNMATFDDVKRVEERLGEDAFRDALEHAEPGWFSERSWAYWNNRLGMARDDIVPQAPSRRF